MVNDVDNIVNSELRGRGRNEYLDSLKYYLMCFVILGHTLMEHLGESAIIDGLHFWIYTFHMPLFVYISGYFSSKMGHEKYKMFLIKTFEILFLFQVVCLFLKYITGEVITWKLIISPQSVYWYLFSLVVWRSMLQLVPEIWLKHKNYVILFSLVVGLISGFIPISNELSIQRTFSFLLFFVLGYYSRQLGWLDLLRRIPSEIVGSIFVFSLIIFFTMLNMGVFTINRVYENMPYSCGIYDVMIRAIIWLLAACNSIAIIRFSKTVRFASIMGTMTLYFFVYHHFFVNILVKISGYFSIQTSIVSCFIESLIVIIICCVLVKIPLFQYAINPITSFIKHK